MRECVDLGSKPEVEMWEKGALRGWLRVEGMRRDTKIQVVEKYIIPTGDDILGFFENDKLELQIYKENLGSWQVLFISVSTIRQSRTSGHIPHCV